MRQRRRERNASGPGVNLSFTAPVDELARFDRAANYVGVTRASFFFRAVHKEAGRILKQAEKSPLAKAS
jgi:uncharacterized protein (DUF1778 family)